MNFYNWKHEKVGFLVEYKDGTKWMYKEVDPAKGHKLLIPLGWATDAEHIGQLKALGANGVRLALPGGKVLEASLETFEKHGFPVNRKHGAQIGLADTHWTEVTRGRLAA
jgi:hypothetical protein